MRVSLPLSLVAAVSALGLMCAPFDGAAQTPVASAQSEDATAPPIDFGPLLEQAEDPAPFEGPAPEAAEEATNVASPDIVAVPALVPTNVRKRFAVRLRGLDRAAQQAIDLLPPHAQPRAQRAWTWAKSPLGRAVLAGALLLAIAAGVARRWLAGRGDLVVTLDYPDELKGVLSVSIATRDGAARRISRNARERLRERVSTATEHHMVARETQFRGLPPRRYFVNVEGALLDPASEAIVAEPFETGDILVEGRRTVRLEFDLRPSGCALEIHVLWDKKPAREASVALLGRPDSLRFARGAPVRLAMPLGEHTVAVGSGDRVAEVTVDIAGYQNEPVVIDLGNSDQIVFKGCPPAVRPYLQGDLSTAARALQREGQEELSHLLLARLHRDQGGVDRAAEHLESAGKLVEAAELRAANDDHVPAAGLYLKAGDPTRAGEMYAAAGDLLRAGKAFDAAGDYDRAISCFREVGDEVRLIGALERSGDVFEAAALAAQRDERGRAISLLQRLPQDSPDYVDACEMLADAYERESHYDLAAAKIEERISRASNDDRPPELYDRWANLLESAGDIARALEVLEDLRLAHPTYTNIATRVEKVKKKLSEERQTSAGGSGPAMLSGEGAASRYELIEQIGRGGMGVVFKARDTRLGRVVALKRLPENLRDHPTAVQFFLREARAAAALNHQNVVTLFDADQENGTFFITMELLEGQPLHNLVRRHGHLSPRDTARLGIQICAGLHYAHQQRIVHRDIKTANLFFTNDKVVKIMDFGLAKMVEEVRRSSTVVGGTPYYMAPEQAAGEAVDARADLYALGVTFYDMLTGAVPFPDGDVAYHHRYTPPPDPRQHVADIPEAMAELIVRMLAKRPDDRPGSALEIAEVLQTLS